MARRRIATSRSGWPPCPRPMRACAAPTPQAAPQGRIAARRQIEGCAQQCANWSSDGGGFYAGLAGRTQATGTLRTRLDRAAQAATGATADFGRFLLTELLPLAPERDAVGRERYALASRSFLGAAIDLDEAYTWGWAEVRRFEAELTRIAGRIVPGGTVEQAVAALEADPARRITGSDNLRSWMQDYADATIAELHGTHFDIPEPARRIEGRSPRPARAASTIGARARTAQGRAGSGGRCPRAPTTSPPGWRSPRSIMRGFPVITCSSPRRSSAGPAQPLAALLSSFPDTARAGHCTRNGSWTSWVTSRTPATGSGCSTSRCCMPRRSSSTSECTWAPIPAGTGWHDGETWNAELAWEFVRSHSQYPDGILRFELNRYLGWPVRRPPTSSASGSGRRPGTRPASGRAPASTKEFHSQALALEGCPVWTRCARRWPAGSRRTEPVADVRRDRGADPGQ